MIMQLRRFYELNNVAPHRIIFYRDGVGNAQFEMIRRNEIYAVRRACTAVGGASYRPQLIFLVVQKRTHCRLFTPEAGGQMLGNALPGTTTDSHFMLQPRASEAATPCIGGCNPVHRRL